MYHGKKTAGFQVKISQAKQDYDWDKVKLGQNFCRIRASGCSVSHNPKKKWQGAVIKWGSVNVRKGKCSVKRGPYAGVCLGGKLSPFSDISQNSTLEKQTLHKIQYEKNRLFTKFNSAHVYDFPRKPHLPLHFFRSQKCALPFFRNQK